MLAALAAAAAVVATHVTTYAPVLPGGAPVAGYCWTRSIAAGYRADAYRCMRGNSIYDPCFTVPAHRGIAVCDVNPSSGRRGFVMRLTRPLPNDPPFTGGGLAPWLVELPGGDVCLRLTGTREQVGRETIGYECSESRALMAQDFATGLLDDSFTAGNVWHVRKAVYRIGRAGTVTATVTRVPLVAVWR